MTDKRNEWEDLRTVLERKLADAEGLNRNLQAEIDRLKADAASNDRSLHQQIHEQQQEIEQLRTSRGSGDGGGAGSRGSSGGDNSQQYQQLLLQHDDLKQELKEQEEVGFSGFVCRVMLKKIKNDVGYRRSPP